MWILFQCVYSASAEAYKSSWSTEETLTHVNIRRVFILFLRHFVLHWEPQFSQLSMFLYVFPCEPIYSITRFKSLNSEYPHIVWKETQCFMHVNFLKSNLWVSYKLMKELCRIYCLIYLSWKIYFPILNKLKCVSLIQVFVTM